MRIKSIILVFGLIGGLFFSAYPAEASIFNAADLFSNIGFETGNISGWKLTKPNSSYVSSLGTLNPSINPADPADNPAVLTAPEGTKFTGLKNPDDADLKYKLVHNAISITPGLDAMFGVNVYANRGRLEPYDTPGSLGKVLVTFYGWTSGTTIPTVNTSDNWSRTANWKPASREFDFTNIADGDWASQTFIFNPADDGIDASQIKYLSISITGQNNNHASYVATDFGLTLAQVVPEPISSALFLLGGGVLTTVRMRMRKV